MQDLYDTLGVSRDATAAQISAAYKSAAKQHHPDRHCTKPNHEMEEHAQKFKAASGAHDILSDPQKRQLYDMYGHAGIGMGAGVTGDDDEMGTDIFEQMYGVGEQQQTRPVGGALFLDAARGSFFQRSWDPTDVETMRQELAESLPSIVTGAHDGAYYKARTSLPHGTSWEVALIDLDADRLTVTLVSHEKGKSAPSMLRIERGFALPIDCAWNVDAAEVTVRETGELTVQMAKLEAEDSRAEDELIDNSAAASAEAAVDQRSTAPMDPRERSATSFPTMPTSRRVRRAKRPQASGLRSGFLSSNATQAQDSNFKTRAAGVQMDQASIENTAHSAMPREPSRRHTSPVSVREVDRMMHTEVDELMAS